jgi:hypothetical protein
MTAVNQTSRFSAGEVNARVLKPDVKSALRSFNDTLMGVLQAFAAPDGVLSLYGVELSGEDRYGVMGSMLIGQFMNENGNASETMISINSKILEMGAQGDRLLSSGG